jgi:deoxyribonuclease (pyrimidine dimer)
MTRINLGIPPESLHRKHLTAEYREIGRISSLVRDRLVKGHSFNDIPKKFTLGRGHVKFFYDKGKWVHKRFVALKQEMIRRGYNPTLDFRNTWPPELYNDYEPTPEDIAIVEQRIADRMPK